MNNNLYQWHVEQMVRHEMQELNQAVEQARLLVSPRSWENRSRLDANRRN